MNTFRPKLFSVMKSYSREQLIKDIISGIIVAIIALPLSIALALASGVKPEEGIYTAIVAGFVISFLGGSRVQIAGPTAAFATIVAGIVAREGMAGLMLATIMAGIILIIMGFLKLGDLIQYIPFTITTGFTSGIAVTIAIGQVKDFLGLTFTETPIETMEKLKEVVKCIGTINWEALLIGLISLAILILWPKVSKKIPGSLIAVIVCAALVKFLPVHVNTIGDLYEISAKLPTLHVPHFTFGTVQGLLPDAATIAILAAIESLLSCVVADGMIGSKHNSNTELIAQGTGNIASALFGGIPATGAIARTAANIKNGGRTPIAGMVHAVVLLLVLVLLMPYAALIPMPTIAAILFMVAYNMSEWRVMRRILKTAPKSDIAVALITLVMTVVFDLVVAIGVGMVLAMLLFMKRMADVTEVHGWKLKETEKDEELLDIPDKTVVFEFNGPMFFAATSNYLQILSDVHNKRFVVLRMRNVSAIDIEGVDILAQFYEICKKRNKVILISKLQDQPRKALEKAGLIEKIGEEHIFPHVLDALEYAKTHD